MMREMSVQFDLPANSTVTVPAFATARTCAEWLEALPLTNAGTAQMRLREQLALLYGSGVRPGVLFEVLEKLRDAVLFVQVEMARKFSFRPLPLADFELVAYNGTVDLWRGFGQAYQVCVQSVLDGDLKSEAARVCQRAIDVQARLVLDLLRANSEIPPSDWQLLHKLYHAAEQAGVATDKVKDPSLRETAATNCVATYARPVLIALGAPQEWSARQTQMISRWTERWATKVTISFNPPAKPVKPPVQVDLSAGRGGYRPEPSRAPDAPNDSVRHLDISDLAKSIKKRVILLRKGESPAKLGLGEDCVMPACEQTLYGLYQHWCDGRAGREQGRRVVSGTALLVGGLVPIHYYMSGKPFKQPGNPTELSAKQRQEIATFGRVATRDDADHSQIHGFVLEEWTMKDESLAGLRLTRAKGGLGMRVAVGQLIATRASDARAYMVAVVRWAQLLEGGDLMIGLKSLPGIPAVLAARQTGLNVVSEKYQQVLHLPAVQSVHAPETLLLPLGWFKAGRVLDLYSERAWQVRLGAMVERGLDFERCTFGPV